MASPVANTLEALSKTLAKAAQDLRSGSLSLESDTLQRMGLLKAGTDLIDTVSLPQDKIVLFLPQIAHLTAIRMFIKWKAFEKVPTDDGATISYKNLAAKLGADVSLISKTSTPNPSSPCGL
jgi:hypothetical protein